MASGIPCYETSGSITVACLSNNPKTQQILYFNYVNLLTVNNFNNS